MRKETKLIRLDVDNIKLLDQLRGKLSYNQFITTVLMDYERMSTRLINYELMADCLKSNDRHRYLHGFAPSVKRLYEKVESTSKQ